jgi:hypothetical protein
MKTLIVLLLLCLVQTGCRNEHNQRVMNSVANCYETADTYSYPLFIDGGTKIVYQVGHMTADKGLKLYLDTLPSPPTGLRLEESVRRKLSIK